MRFVSCVTAKATIVAFNGLWLSADCVSLLLLPLLIFFRSFCSCVRLFVFFFDYFCRFVRFSTKKISERKRSSSHKCREWEASERMRRKDGIQSKSENTIFIVILCSCCPFPLFFFFILILYFTWSFQFDAIFHIISLHRSTQSTIQLIVLLWVSCCVRDALRLGHERQFHFDSMELEWMWKICKGTNKTH